VLEVDDVMLDFWAEERVIEGAPGENDDAVKPVVCLQQAKTFTADKAGCAEE
jgi:hypothetical protein